MIQNIIYILIGALLVIGWIIVVKIWRKETKEEKFHDLFWGFCMLSLTICWLIFLPSIILQNINNL